MKSLTYNKNIESNNPSAIDYILILLLILMSSNPFMLQNHLLFLIITFLIIIFKVKLSIRQLSVSKYDFMVIFFFFAYEIIHLIIFQDIRLLNIFRLTFLGYVACMVIKVTNKNFVDIYLKIIYVLAIVSLVAYPLLNNNSFYYSVKEMADFLFPLRKDINDYYTPTLIFITLDPASLFFGNLYRNAGFAWEAGAFAIFLNIALSFNLFLKKNDTILNKKNIIYIIAIVSTFSTTGYVILFFELLAYNLLKSTKRLTQIIYLIVFLFLSINLFINQEFLSKKIQKQLSQASKSQNRFGAAILDISDWKEKPLFGWSRNTEIIMEQKRIGVIELHRPNGITYLLRSYGILYFVVFMTLMYMSFMKLSNNYKIEKYKLIGMILFLVVFFSAFSQLIFDLIFFKSLLFFGEYIYMRDVINDN